MRSLFGAALAAALFALVVPGSAEAATGWVSINGFTYSNPRGCYGPGHTNLTIVNHTNKDAVVYTGKHCDHGVDQILKAGKATYTNKGSSVYVP